MVSNKLSSIRLPLLLCFVVVPAVGLAQKPAKQGAQKQNAHHAVLNAREQAFVAQATADDAMQIALAKLAMGKSSNPQLRALASRIVSDHSALNLQFTRLASSTSSKGRAHGVPAQDVSAMQAHLKSLQGAAFDQAFAGMMVKEHRKIIAAYEVAAKTSTDDRLKTIASRGLPVLQGHLDAARALMKQGSPADKRREDK
jgi:putative membrane protein